MFSLSELEIIKFRKTFQRLYLDKDLFFQIEMKSKVSKGINQDNVSKKKKQKSKKDFNKKNPKKEESELIEGWLIC